MLRFIYYHQRSCILIGSLPLLYLSFFLHFSPFFSCLGLGYLALLYFLSSRYTRQVTKTYMDDCDPEPYLEMGLWNIRRFQKARTSRSRTSLVSAHLCAVSALCGLGRYGEALELLDKLDREEGLSC